MTFFAVSSNFDVLSVGSSIYDVTKQYLILHFATFLLTFLSLTNEYVTEYVWTIMSLLVT